MATERLEWLPAEGGNIPEGAIPAGVEGGDEMYVARAHVEGSVIPGTLYKSQTSVFIPFNTKEISVEKYDILCGPPACLSWVECPTFHVPFNAVIGGKCPKREALYIGRVIHENIVTVGKVHPSHRRCYFTFDGKEHSKTQYEILVKNRLGQFLKV